MEISEERKALYQYARLRKLPEVINLGNIDKSKKISLLEDLQVLGRAGSSAKRVLRPHRKQKTED